MSGLSRIVHRPSASATWEHVHHWGSSFGDTTTLRVTRVDGGLLRVTYGNDAVEIRPALVAVFAQMVAAAAEWTDAETGEQS